VQVKKVAPRPVRPAVKTAAPAPLPRPPAAEPRLAVPFNGNSLFGPELKANYLTKFNIQSCIETGTYKGSSTLWFSQNLPEVHTIENNGELFNENKARFAGKNNIRPHLGNSPQVLAAILRNWDPTRRAIFYLDAHWNDYWPLNDELLAISKSSARDNCLILIDDFQVPGRPDIPFDSYKSQPLNLQFVAKNLRLALPDLHYEYYAPPPAHAKSRGRLIAFPKSWLNPPV